MRACRRLGLRRAIRWRDAVSRADYVVTEAIRLAWPTLRAARDLRSLGFARNALCAFAAWSTGQLGTIVLFGGSHPLTDYGSALCEGPLNRAAASATDPATACSMARANIRAVPAARSAREATLL